MAIWRKTVGAVTSNAGRVLLPKKYIGTEVWIISDKDIDDLQELITITLLYRKAYKLQQSEFIEEFEKSKADFERRIKRLEGILIT